MIFVCLSWILQPCWTNLVTCVSSFLLFFFVDSLEFSMLSIRPSVNKDSCDFSFHICVSLTIFFFNLNALARTSSTMLIKSCESWLPYFVPSLVGEVFSFSQSSIMSFLVVQVVKNLPPMQGTQASDLIILPFKWYNRILFESWSALYMVYYHKLPQILFER